MPPPVAMDKAAPASVSQAACPVPSCPPPEPVKLSHGKRKKNRKEPARRAKIEKRGDKDVAKETRRYLRRFLLRRRGDKETSL